MKLAQPIVSIACILPLLYGAMLRRERDPQRAQRHALFGAVSTLVVVVGIAAMYYASSNSVASSALVERSVALFGSRVHYQMGVDALTVPFLLLIAFAVLAIVAAGPRADLTPDTLSALLLSEGFTLGMFAARDLVLFSACWIAALIPMNAWTRARLPSTNVARRVLLLMSVGSSVPLVLAMIWLGFAREHDAGVFDLLALHAQGVPQSVQTPIFVLVALAALIRMGVVPFHAWLPAIWRGAPLPISAMTVVAPAGVYLLARFGLPLLPHPAAGRVPLIADLALVSALYGALLALGQKDLKRMLGALAISQSGLMLIGLASTNPQGEAGAILLCIGDRVALCGLLSIVWLVRHRTGTTDMSKLGGLVTSMPLMAGAFVTFALANMGAPGTLGFIAEDLLVSGIIEAYPWIATVVVGATVLNGITLLRAFSRVFLGPSLVPGLTAVAQHNKEGDALLPDLSGHEHWVAAALIAFLVITGVAPDALTQSVRRATREMEPTSVTEIAIHHVAAP